MPIYLLGSFLIKANYFYWLIPLILVILLSAAVSWRQCPKGERHRLMHLLWLFVPYAFLSLSYLQRMTADNSEVWSPSWGGADVFSGAFALSIYPTAALCVWLARGFRLTAIAATFLSLAHMFFVAIMFTCDFTTPCV